MARLAAFLAIMALAAGSALAGESKRRRERESLKRRARGGDAFDPSTAICAQRKLQFRGAAFCRLLNFHFSDSMHWAMRPNTFVCIDDANWEKK